MASGVVVNDASIKTFESIKTSKTNRFAIFGIVEKKIDVEQVGNRNANYDEFLSKLKADGRQCRYGVYDFEYGTKQKLFSILWCPDAASVTQKMLYASSYETLKQAFVGIQNYIEANDDDEAEQSTVEQILRSTDH